MKSFLFLIKCEITSYALEFIKGKNCLRERKLFKRTICSIQCKYSEFDDRKNIKFKVSYINRIFNKKKMTNYSKCNGFLIVKIETSMT